MVIDLAFGTGGQRPSRSRRSGGAQIDTGDVSVRSQDFARDTAARLKTDNTLAAIGAAGDQFFGALRAQQAEEDLEAIRRENAREIARIEGEVRANRKEAREAIRTGDFSKFIPDDEFRRREVIRDSFISMTAQQMAYEDFHADLNERIKATPIGANPDAVVAEFLKEKTKDANPIFARDYGRVAARLAGPATQEFRQSRLELQQMQAERTAIELFKSEIGGGAVPPTMEGLRALRRKAIPAMPMNSPSAVMRLDALLDDTLIDMAAQGNAQALRMALLKDEDRDGTSVLDRNRLKLEKTVGAYIQTKRAVRSLEAFNNLEELDNRLALVKAGQPLDGDTLGLLWKEIMLHPENFGDESEQWEQLRDRAISMMNKEGIDRGSVLMVARGLIPQMSDADWDTFGENIVNGRVQQMLEAEGMDPGLAQNRLVSAIANRGSPKVLRDTMSARLKSSKDADEFKQAFDFMREIDIRYDGPIEDHLGDERAALIYHLSNWASQSGQDPAQVRQQFLEAQNAADGTDVRPETHFENRQTDPGDDDSTTIGRAGALVVAKEVYESLPDTSLEVSRFFGLSSGLPSWDRLTPAARQRLLRAVNLSSFMLSNTTGDVDAIKQMAASMVVKNFGLELGPDGDIDVTLDRTPRAVADETGSPVPGRRVDREAIERVKESLEADENAVIMTLIGGNAGVAQDDLTSKGYGMAVRSGASGFPQDVTVRSDQRMEIPISELPEQFVPAFFEEVSRDEQADVVVLKAPGRPEFGAGARVNLSDNLFMVYDRPSDSWRLRWQDKENKVDPMTLEELAEKNRAMRREAVRPDAVIQREERRLRERNQRLRDVNRRQGLFAPIGAPVPPRDAPGPLSGAEEDAIRGVHEEALDSFVADGVVSPQSRLEDDDTASIQERTGRMLERERSSGGWLDDITKPVNERFLHKTSAFISKHEGRVPFVYDDHTGRAWGPNSKGDPHIGIGFNLKRPDAAALLKQVGADHAKIMRGEQVLTDAQMDKLLGLTMKDTANWLREHFDGVNMANHRWMSLLSLAYNSRWSDRGPTLIGPRLTKAIREGDWKSAEREIRENSLGGVPRNLLPGITARRNEEADLFAGLNLEGLA